MSLTMAILILVGMWLSVAAAMLWGVLRIVRRHAHPHHLPPSPWPNRNLCAVPGAMPGRIDSRFELHAMNDKREPRPSCFSPEARRLQFSYPSAASRFKRARRAKMLRISIAVEKAMAAYT